MVVWTLDSKLDIILFILSYEIGSLFHKINYREIGCENNSKYCSCSLLLLLLPFYGPLDFVRDYPGEPAPER